ncbi:MAG: hypothetical protein U9Q21_03205 [Candidatus Auribacterota bacterium]|nr:hypothetical protein [Candidatus Auribacterota bacterium]
MPRRKPKAKVKTSKKRVTNTRAKRKTVKKRTSSGKSKTRVRAKKAVKKTRKRLPKEPKPRFKFETAVPTFDPEVIEIREKFIEVEKEIMKTMSSSEMAIVPDKGLKGPVIAIDEKNEEILDSLRKLQRRFRL